ncbi:uncharacterized protein LOC141715067 [Apium graveolens]|uniref:uncharacterized protein LOC141715067 n=1 Tax=Apium graveolens TaxID=4045 RepID=UPI003D7AF1EA
MLAYGTPADSIDDYVRIGESTTIGSLRIFVKAVVVIFCENYLRRPTNEDEAKLLEENKRTDFPVMLGNIDCMHWKWKNCPSAWLERSNLSEKLAKGLLGLEVGCTINGHEFNMGYYLTTAAQETARIDVERTFGVLQDRFAMIHRPSHFWDIDTMKDIMAACIILHNIIFVEERELNFLNEKL